MVDFFKKKDTTLYVRIPEYMKHSLEYHADQQEVSLSELVREILKASQYARNPVPVKLSSWSKDENGESINTQDDALMYIEANGKTHTVKHEKRELEDWERGFVQQITSTSEDPYLTIKDKREIITKIYKNMDEYRKNRKGGETN